MISIFLRSIKKFFFRNNIIKDTKSICFIAKGVIIKNSSIHLKNSELIVDKNVCLRNTKIVLSNAKVHIGNNSIIEGLDSRPLSINIDSGELIIGNHTKINCVITIRFGGKCIIGDYNAINDGTELRCDEKIIIGSFNMISYNCTINDTNTHEILSVEERRQRTIKEFPIIGSEYKKPSTNPVIIGSDCWFGKGATILKGVNIGDSCIIGTQSVVTKNIPDFHLAVGNPAKILKQG